MADPGYQAADGHPQQRAAWQAHFDSGGTWTCRHCHRTITSHTPWDLGHGRALALGGNGDDSEPEHAHCNRSKGAQLGNRLRQRPRASQTW